MLRTNTAADVANTGVMKIDAGEGVQAEMPVSLVPNLAARLAALEYDSGLRNIADMIVPGWETSAVSVYLLRDGRTVNLSLRNMRRTDGATGSIELLTLPAGFRPPSRQDSRTFRDASLSVRTDGVVALNGVGATSDQASLTWITLEAAPTTPPGNPA